MGRTRSAEEKGVVVPFGRRRRSSPFGPRPAHEPVNSVPWEVRRRDLPVRELRWEQAARREGKSAVAVVMVRAMDSRKEMVKAVRSVRMPPFSEKTEVAVGRRSGGKSSGEALRLMPRPTTTKPEEAWRTDSRRMPQTLRSARKTSLGHLMVAGGSAGERSSVWVTARAAAWVSRDQSSGGREGRRRMERMRLRPGGEIHAAPRRPRPEDWESAVMTEPWGAPESPRVRASSLVELVESRQRAVAPGQRRWQAAERAASSSGERNVMRWARSRGRGRGL